MEVDPRSFLLRYDEQPADLNLAFVYSDHGNGFPTTGGRGGQLAHVFLPR